ncbi:T9SS type A sorting domain-containing protein [Hymenobacter baengnokdamensis]|uniref:T9SS type A sorting domain-containing protein n=1 Tax=Hymenobacter baengnokdamensis TaxID=2615203 RepID=UPI001780520C|nr:T9SS type A sorting domain-containing protein [Hymenobacter baengnokdamensis]
MNSYTRVSSWSHRLRQLGLTALLLGGAAVAGQAQNLNYTVGTAANVAGTYTDLAATGTAITTANTDDANSTAQDIGFTFSYNNLNFTQFILNTNGFIKLGATAPSDTKLFLSETDANQLDVFQSPNDPNVIAAFNADLTAAAVGGTEYRVATTGTAPNRVCTIQWKNVSDKAATNPTQYTNLNFQVRLYETTNVVELVYGPTTAGTTSALRFMQAGVKGTSLSNGQGVQPTKQSSAAWSTAVFSDFATVISTQVLNTVNFRSIAPPDAGRTFRFSPAPPTDAAVKAIYTLGKIATQSALPHSVKAVISNTGSTALTSLPVTLTVSGANTFTDTQTIGSLAVGASATVTFAAYPTTLATGTNSVVVTIPNDGNAANNTATYGQLVTPDRISYTDPSVNSNLSVGLGNAIFAAKYTLPAATVIGDVIVTFGAITGNTAPFQVVIYDASGTGGIPGQALYTSATQNRTAAGGPVTVTLPGVAVPASFYVAVKETSATNVGVSYQVEDPIRPSTFYYTANNGTTWTDFINVTPKARVAIEFGTIVPNCSAPTGVVASNVTATGATIAFTAPATGTSGYQIVYGPTGFNVVTGGTTVTTTTASPVVLTGLTPATTYQVYVRSNCSAGGTSVYITPVTFTTACDPTNVVSTFPYSQNFDTILSGQSLPCGITTLDANNDGTTWRISTENPYSGTNDMRYNGIPLNNVAADDWFFTPALVLAPASSSTRYQVAFRYRTSGVGTTSTGTESLEVKSGTAATVAGQTNLLFTNNAITNTTYALANGSSTPVVALLPAGTSTQYVGFHIKSAANQGNLYIDDVSVTAVTVTATTSEALLKATTVFPNPSNGVFSLDIHGANAKGSLGVQVVNTLGQVVYTGSARDNYSNKLDLSNLAPGLYNLQLRNGDDTLTRQIAIVK